MCSETCVVTAQPDCRKFLCKTAATVQQEDSMVNSYCSCLAAVTVLISVCEEAMQNYKVMLFGKALADDAVLPPAQSRADLSWVVLVRALASFCISRGREPSSSLGRVPAVNHSFHAVFRGRSHPDCYHKMRQSLFLCFTSSSKDLYKSFCAMRRTLQCFLSLGMEQEMEMKPNFHRKMCMKN